MDQDDYCSLYTHSVVMQNAGGVLTNEQATTLFNQSIFQMNKTEPTNFTWIIETQDSSTFCGVQGIKTFADNNHPAEIGIMLTPQAMGKGYSVEGMGALCDFAFAALNVQSIIANVPLENTASVAFLLRLGFVKQEKTQGDMHLFTLDKPNWLQSSSRIVAQ